MGGYPLAALQVNPPPDIADQRYKRQQQKQHLQTGALDLQMKQQEAKDQQTVMQTLAKHKGDIDAALPELAGTVSARTFMGIQKAQSDLKTSIASLDDKKLQVQKDQHDRLVGLISQAQSLPPDQYAQQYPAIIQEAVKIKPDLAGHIDPNQPIPQEALSQFGLGIMTQAQFEARETAKRAEAKAKQDVVEATETARHNKAMEGKPPAEEAEFQAYYQNYLGSSGQQPSAQLEFKARQEYTKMKRAPTSEPGQYFPLVDEQGKITGAWNPKTGKTVAPPTIEGARKNALPPTENVRRANAETMVEKLNEVEQLAKDNPGALGPIAGRLESAKQATLGSTPEKTELHRAANDVADMLLRARSGAAINEAEYTRLRKLVPNPNQPVATFMSNLAGFRRELQTIQNKSTGKPGEVQPSGNGSQKPQSAKPAAKGDPLGIR